MKNNKLMLFACILSIALVGCGSTNSSDSNSKDEDGNRKVTTIVLPHTAAYVIPSKKDKNIIYTIDYSKSCGSAADFRVLDISKPLKPKELLRMHLRYGGTSVAQRGSMITLSSDGKRLYVAVYGEVIILDVQDAKNPQILFKTTDYYHKFGEKGLLKSFGDIVLSKDDKTLYVNPWLTYSDIPYALSFDVSNPASPKNISTFGNQEFDTIKLYDNEKKAIVGYTDQWGSGYIATIDLSNPKSPKMLGYNDYLNVSAIEVSPDGKIAYIAEPISKNYEALIIMDISDPTAPKEISRLKIYSDDDLVGGQDIVLSKNKKEVYLSTTDGIVHLINIKNPKEPKEIFTKGRMYGRVLKLSNDKKRLFTYGVGTNIYMYKL